MSEHFNCMRPDEQERLACCLEEAAEVIQIAGKILRHGYGSYNPLDDKRTSNQSLLEKEIGDFLAVLDMMVGAGDLRGDLIDHHRANKPKRMAKYLHHQRTK